MAHEHPTESGHGTHHGVGHIVPPKILIATAVALLVLTGITVGAAKIAFDAVEMQELTIVVALGIALVKASLVCLFFMHLRWDRPFNSFVLCGSLGLVVLFIVFALTDSNQYQPEIDARQELTSTASGETTVIQAELDKLPAPPPPASRDALDQHAPQNASSGAGAGH